MDRDLREKMIDTFTLVCHVLETHRTKGVDTLTGEGFEIFKSCVVDADYAVKMQYGYEIREIFA